MKKLCKFRYQFAEFWFPWMNNLCEGGWKYFLQSFIASKFYSFTFFPFEIEIQCWRSKKEKEEIKSWIEIWNRNESFAVEFMKIEWWEKIQREFIIAFRDYTEFIQKKKRMQIFPRDNRALKVLSTWKRITIHNEYGKKES